MFARRTLSLNFRTSKNIGNLFSSRFENVRRATTGTATTSNKIVYVTDLEGDYEYWQRYLQFSSVLQRGNNGNLTMPDGYHFVFGGDVCDRGTGDLRIITDLIKLKESYPDRVDFILGNRDINKLRLPYTLHDGVIQYYPKCYWLRTPDFHEQAKRDVVLHQRYSKLQWVLGKTMGAPISYTSRQSELQQISNTNTSIDNDTIVNSYVQSLSPTYLHNTSIDSYKSILLKYLSYGKISLILNNNLFVHGAIDDFNMGWLPPTTPNTQGTRANNIHEWSNEINKFAKQQIQCYIDESENYMKSLSSTADIDTVTSWLWEISGGYGHSQPGSSLLQYGMGSYADKTRNPSVIYATYLRNGVAMPPSDHVMSWLQRDGIDTLIVGHQPNGDCPWIVKKSQSVEGSKRFQVISADNCYAKYVQYSNDSINRIIKQDDANKIQELDEVVSADQKFSTAEEQGIVIGNKAIDSSRGTVTVAEMIINCNNNDNSNHTSDIEVRGVLSTGWKYTISTGCKSSLVGCKVMGDWYVKADNITIPNNEGKYVLLANSSEGFKFKSLLVDHELLNVPY